MRITGSNYLNRSQPRAQIHHSLDSALLGDQSLTMSQFQASLHSLQEVLKGLPSLQPALEEAAAFLHLDLLLKVHT